MKTLSPLLILFILFILSSCDPHVYFDMRDNNSYKWEKIGEQFWLERNMNYLPNVSPNTDVSLTDTVYYVAGYNGTGTDVAKTTENYKTYGVLYNWLAAQSACPEGWHLPSDDEWEQLAQYISDQNGGYDKDGDDWQNVGSHLKTKKGWDNNGTDNYRFSAKPGGMLTGSGSLYYIGRSAYWWSNMESVLWEAFGRSLDASNDGFFRGSAEKKFGFSVRCISDPDNDYFPLVYTNEISEINTNSANSGGTITYNGDLFKIKNRGICWNTSGNPKNSENATSNGSGSGEFTSTLENLEPGTTYFVRAFASTKDYIFYGNEVTFTTNDVSGTFVDGRDNTNYKWILIGSQIWMAENLKYLPDVSPPSVDSNSESFYYVNDYFGADINVAKATENYNKYGVLYNWSAAQCACPEGWHLPSNDEWTLLGQFVCDHLYIHSDDECEWIVDQYVGKHLKSTSDDWIIGAPHGGDYYNFSGLPGGVSYNQGGGNNGFAIIGYTANWWSATEGNINSAWCRYISNSASSLQRGDKSKNYGYSVRCIKD